MNRSDMWRNTEVNRNGVRRLAIGINMKICLPMAIDFL